MSSQRKNRDARALRASLFCGNLSARLLAGCLGELEVSEADLAAVVRQMQTWDGKREAESSCATVYEVTIRQAVRLVLRPGHLR